jgi:hypothetical protein
MTKFENSLGSQREKAIFEPNFLPLATQTILKLSFITYQSWKWNRQSVPKRQHIKFRRWWITQKKKHTTYRTRRKFEIKNLGVCRQCSETSTYKIQTLVDYTKKTYNIQNTAKVWNQEFRGLQTECSETSTYKIQTLRDYPKENIQHTEHAESLKSRM